MRSTISLAVPQPCNESWADMTPTAIGRHCAACQKTVVDFTLKTDAEILAYLAQASSNVCGRLWDDQLARPLVPPAPLAFPSRWRTWLAATLVAWAVREGTAAPAEAQVQAARQAPHPRKKNSQLAPAVRASIIRGMVRDLTTGQPVAGAAVFLQGENRHTTADSAGRFSLPVPAGWRARRSLIVHLFGYHSQVVEVPAAASVSKNMTIDLTPDAASAEIQVVGVMPSSTRSIMLGGAISMVSIGPPASPARPSNSRPRSFYDWLTKPFRRRPTS